MPIVPHRRDQDGRNQTKAVLDLPPPFRAVALHDGSDAFAHAKLIAAEAGAGTLVHAVRFGLADCAIVLQSDEPLYSARRAVYVGAVAIAEATAPFASPDKPIAFVRPDAITLGGRLLGGVRLAWPADTAENGRPSWLVLAAMIRIAGAADGGGMKPPTAAPSDGDFGDIQVAGLIERFARRFMVWTDTWEQRGFGAIADAYLGRLSATPGTRLEIAGNGDLDVSDNASLPIVRRPLVAMLAKPGWLDPATGTPRA